MLISTTTPKMERMAPDVPFSQRFGYAPSDPAISVINDAPPALRRAVWIFPGRPMFETTLTGAIFKVADRYSFQIGRIRSVESAWNHLERCNWYEVYEVAEETYAGMGFFKTFAEDFQEKLNVFCRHNGIGWKMENGRFVRRFADEEDVLLVRTAEMLAAAKKTTSAREFREALADLSKRPNPDVTGAVQHVSAAIECLARDLCGNQKITLGEIIARHPALFPGAYRKLAEAVWGIASNKGRHIAEGAEPTVDEAMFLIGTVAALASYLLSARDAQGIRD